MRHTTLTQAIAAAKRYSYRRGEEELFVLWDEDECGHVVVNESSLDTFYLGERVLACVVGYDVEVYS